jgi:GTPase SAR1 family protein
LREDAGYLAKTGAKAVTPQEGETLRSQIKALRYIECSAKTRFEVNTVFNEAIRIVLGGGANRQQKKKKGGCALL